MRSVVLVSTLFFAACSSGEIDSSSEPATESVIHERATVDKAVKREPAAKKSQFTALQVKKLDAVASFLASASEPEIADCVAIKHTDHLNGGYVAKQKLKAVFDINAMTGDEFIIQSWVSAFQKRTKTNKDMEAIIKLSPYMDKYLSGKNYLYELGHGSVRCSDAMNKAINVARGVE